MLAGNIHNMLKYDESRIEVTAHTYLLFNTRGHFSSIMYIPDKTNKLDGFHNNDSPDNFKRLSDDDFFFENDKADEEAGFCVALIENLAVLIVQVTELKEKKDYRTCHIKIKEYVEKLLSTSIGNVSKISYPELIDYIHQSNIGTTETFLALAEVFKMEADICKCERTEVEAINIYLNSLSLYIDTLLSDPDLIPENYEEKINELVQAVGLYEMTDWALFQLFKYYELTNRFGKAEDLLFELLSMAALLDTKSISYIEYKPKMKKSRVETINEGIAFYNRMLTKNAIELAKGDLPMDEAIEGLKQVLKLKDLYEKMK